MRSSSLIFFHSIDFGFIFALNVACFFLKNNVLRLLAFKLKGHCHFPFYESFSRLKNAIGIHSLSSDSDAFLFSLRLSFDSFIPTEIILDFVFDNFAYYPCPLLKINSPATN